MMDSERMDDSQILAALQNIASFVTTGVSDRKDGETLDRIHTYLADRLRALEQREAATLPRDVPEGWVPVPKVPTAEMIEAMRHDDNWPSLLTGEAQRIYAAALAAAPSGEVG